MVSIDSVLSSQFTKVDHVFLIEDDSDKQNQQQTNYVFSHKWTKYSEEDAAEQQRLFSFQKKWYLELYGFQTEQELAEFLKTKSVVLDAGCGLGYKAKWFADLSPSTLVIGMDYSDAAFIAGKRYQDTPNLVFLKGDIANTYLNENSIDYVSCDQVIHHTEDVAKTYSELVRVLDTGGELAVYVYAKKALPRELVDDFFRTETKNISNEEMLEFSQQLTQLGKSLSELNVKVQVPSIPILGIKEGEYDIQRFIYWNFLKCFWNEELGTATSDATNYDWYAPSNATRYSQAEFLAFAQDNNLKTVYLHNEEAAHSGRFKK